MHLKIKCSIFNNVFKTVWKYIALQTFLNKLINSQNLDIPGIQNHPMQYNQFSAPPKIICWVSNIIDRRSGLSFRGAWSRFMLFANAIQDQQNHVESLRNIFILSQNFWMALYISFISTFQILQEVL